MENKKWNMEKRRKKWNKAYVKHSLLTEVFSIMVGERLSSHLKIT